MVTKLSIPFLYDYVFPNFILPNALMLEYGIVNYLHTMYDNRLSMNSFFEEKLVKNDKYETAVPHVYGNALGLWPNSLRHNGSHMKAAMYETKVNIIEESLYLGKTKYQRYIYPIKVPPHFDKFTGYNISDCPRLNGEYFWKHMSAEALADARSGKAIIFLDYAQENSIEKMDYDRLHAALEFSYIPAKNIILAFNSFNAKEVYESWYKPEYRRLEVWNWPFMTTNSSYHYKHHIQSNGQAVVSTHEFKQSALKLRKNHLLFKIRRRRDHRMALLYKFVSDGLLDKIDWSCLEEHQFEENTVRRVAERYGLENNIDAVRTLYETVGIPHFLQSEQEEDKNYHSIHGWTPWDGQAHKESYVYLCTETVTDTPYKAITEKVFKPLANFMPLIFFGPPNTLTLLRELGFKTFFPWIDESYDVELDDRKRAQMIYTEIKRLCSMNLEDLHKWYWEMEDILLHNREVIQVLYEQEKESIKLIEYLYSRVTQ
jgi:hypothetical protein